MSHTSPLLQPWPPAPEEQAPTGHQGAEGMNLLHKERGERGSARERSQTVTEVIIVKNDTLCFVLCCPPW